MAGPLEGITVLDLSHYVAGPYCTKLLADYGADVIKVEPPGAGDPCRSIGPFQKDRPGPDGGALFLHLNTNKRSISLDLKSVEGRAIFLELAQTIGDIVVENFAPRVMPSIGLEYDDLRSANPKLIMTSISNFGQTGSWRDRRASELTELALSQFLYITGDPDREPLAYYGHQAQYQAGLNAGVATLAVYYGAETAGSGQHIDVSILECLVGITERQFQRYPYSGEIRERTGHAGEGFPWAVYPCRDGWVAAYSSTTAQWRGLCEMVGLPDLAGLSTVSELVENRSQIEPRLLAWLADRSKLDVFHEAQSHGIPWVPVYDAADLLADPQLADRGFFVEIDHPIVGKLLYPGAPFKLSDSPAVAGRGAPMLGEHNLEIFQGILGKTESQIERLAADGVI